MVVRSDAASAAGARPAEYGDATRSGAGAGSRPARAGRAQRRRQVARLSPQPDMNLRVFRTAEDAAHAAAAALAAQLRRKPASGLGLPTGRTSLEVYDELARLHESGEADFSQAHTFNLDEFVGLPSSDKRSYCAFMQKHLFTRINLPASHIHFLNGGAPDHERECD